MLPLLLAAAAHGRPATIDFVDGVTARCHWAFEVDEPLCLRVLDAIEAARSAQVGQLGWPAPPSDGERGGDGRFDVYLVYSDGWTGPYDVRCDEDDAGGCIDVDPGDGLARASSYARIDPRTDPTRLDVAVHRAYAEAVLLGVDHAQRFEAVRGGTAAWLALQGLEDPSWLRGPIADYQAAPWASALLSDAADLHAHDGRWTEYDAGAVVWASEVGSAPLLRIWEAGSSDAGGSEPDVLDAWGPTDEALLDLAVTRARIGKARAPVWSQFVGAEGAARREAALWGAGGSVVPEDPPLPLGTVYADVYLLAGETVLVDVESDADVRWGVLAVEDEARSDATAVGTRLEYTALLDGTITVGAMNLGPPGFDADDPLEPAPMRLHVRTPLEDEPPAEVCGCATGGGLGWTWLGLVALARRRR